ncbi:hemerythrin domain-containing protein [Candidatus Falkowbacteria bacterium]|nr:hemerythrin domain-containing protein [Candidatus Falkowbacteria bacterium]
MVQKLIEQHAKLRALLEEMKAAAEQSEGNASVVSLQAAFKEALIAHLALENEDFYPRLIAAIGASDIPTEGVERIKRFIAGMKEIGESVNDFLKKYQSEDLIMRNWNDYRKDLAKCTSLLEIRMESEEDGVYMEWEIYGTNINHWKE